MPIIKIKGEEYSIVLTRDAFHRRSIQYGNSIIKELRRINVDEVDVSEETSPVRKAPANVSWWVEGIHCHYTYNKMSKYADNLLVILRVIENYVNKVLEEVITLQEFIELFEEHDDHKDQKAEAREFFGLAKDDVNLDSINKKYRLLSKTLHPDMPSGDTEKFKELNKHHKVLKRELE